jgi:hypothetical protein
MTKKEPKRPKPPETQKTQKDYEIPVPRRGDFYKALEKAVEPNTEDENPSNPRRGGKDKK